MGQLSMPDVASLGQVSVASSYDERFPPSNMIDGDPSSFWASTGLYPQEFVVELDKAYDISSVKLIACNVKSVSLEKCDTDDPSQFAALAGPVKVGTDSNAMRPEMVTKDIPLQLPTRARHVKFKIEDGLQPVCGGSRVWAYAPTSHLSIH